MLVFTVIWEEREEGGERRRGTEDEGRKGKRGKGDGEKGDGRVIPTLQPRGKRGRGEGEERGNITVLHPTLFSHSNSAHIFLNSASVHEAGWM